MTEKTSRLLSRVKGLINDQKFEEALLICEDILKSDENNVNALLMSTKCWMDLDLAPTKVKAALERVLLLKPKHPTATQGLRKFYEKHFSIFLDDAIIFYRDLYQSKELTVNDISFITKDIAKLQLALSTEEFVIDCLLTQIIEKCDEDCLTTFYHISIEKYIVGRTTELFDKLCQQLVLFTSDDPSATVANVRKMTTFVNAVISGKSAADVFDLMTELSIVNTYASIIFGRLLCDHYLMLDCEDTIVMGNTQSSHWQHSTYTLGLKQLQVDIVFDRDAMLTIAYNMRLVNLIHLGDLCAVESGWDEVNHAMISNYVWFKSFAIGVNKFTNDTPLTLCSDLPDHQRFLCHAIVSHDMVGLPQFFDASLSLTSFEWYLLANVLRVLDRPDDVLVALKFGLKEAQVYFKIYVELSTIYSKKNEYGMAVKNLEKGLELYFSGEVVEALVDLHMEWKKYAEPLHLLDQIDVDNCSDTLLLKFTQCLMKLGRTTDAIALATRIVKQSPNQSEYWQLLGDLYLQRNNVNHAYKTYQKCVQLSGENCDNCARLGNVFSLNYQGTMEENEFTKSLDFYDKSLAFGISKDALIGKSALLYLHADVSLKQLMLSSAIRDLNAIITLVTCYSEQLRDSEFTMNMIGKVMLLSVMGSVDKMLDISLMKKCYFPEAVEGDYCDLALTCFEAAICRQRYHVEAHYNCGLTGLCKLNRKCVDVKRGQLVDNALYGKVERHFKNVLMLDEKSVDAWRYLGYLYLRHGISTEKIVFDIEHCFRMAIDSGTNIDRLNDPESAFYLGMLYSRENWYELAREVFEKIKMDYPVDPIGYIGLYLLSSKDHTVEEQPEIAKALMSYVYRDETINVIDSCHRLSDSVVGLFAENMAFLVHSTDEKVTFDGRVDKPSLVLALRTSMSTVWTKYLAYSSIGCTFSEQETKQFNEYGCCLGVIELLVGDYQYGKKLVSKSTLNTDNTVLQTYIKLDEWNKSDEIKNSDLIFSLCKSLNLKLNQDNITTTNASLPATKPFDEMLLSAMIANMSLSRCDTLVSKYLHLLITGLDSLHQLNLPVNDQATILLALGSFLFTFGDCDLSTSFLRVLDRYYAGVVDSDERVMRVVAHLKLVASTSVTEVYHALYQHCLKQPWSMNRWLNLLEFGLEHCRQLTDAAGSFTIGRLFFITNRPWCMTPLDIERYSRLLATYADSITTDALHAHRIMFFKTTKLFPDACVSLIGRYSQL